MIYTRPRLYALDPPHEDDTYFPTAGVRPRRSNVVAGHTFTVLWGYISKKTRVHICCVAERSWQGLASASKSLSDEDET